MDQISIIGLGRIGRAVFRILDKSRFMGNVSIVELNNDIDNLIYLLNFDSIYGLRAEKYKKINNKTFINIDTNKVFSKKTINDINTGIVIDCTGNLKTSFSFKNNKKINRVYITNADKNKIVDKFIISGVSKKSKSKFISLSICDATAVGPILSFIDNNYSLLSGNITTLHPWLGYQNLNDNSLISMSIPSNYHKEFALGRKATESLISKPTSIVNAIELAMPKLKNKLTSWSYRVPTPIVSSAILNIRTKLNIKSKDHFINKISNLESVELTNRNRISSDFIGSEYNASINTDSIFIKGNNLYLTSWYDNEYGYSQNILNYIFKNENLIL